MLSKKDSSSSNCCPSCLSPVGSIPHLSLRLLITFMALHKNKHYIPSRFLKPPRQPTRSAGLSLKRRMHSVYVLVGLSQSLSSQWYVPKLSKPQLVTCKYINFSSNQFTNKLPRDASLTSGSVWPLGTLLN